MHRRKPHKGLQKRVKVSARGKLVHRRAFAGHLLSGKSGDRRRHLRRPGQITGKLADNIRRALNVDYLNPDRQLPHSELEGLESKATVAGGEGPSKPATSPAKAERGAAKAPAAATKTRRARQPAKE